MSNISLICIYCIWQNINIQQSINNCLVYIMRRFSYSRLIKRCGLFFSRASKFNVITPQCWYLWKGEGQTAKVTRLFHSLLHSPDGRQFCLSSGLYKGLSVAFLKHRNSHRSHEPTMHCNLPRIQCLLANHTIRNTSQSKAMSHTTLTVPQPADLDCVTVYIPML